MEVIEIHDPKCWSPSWLDSQPIEETPPFVPSQTCDTELDDEEMKDEGNTGVVDTDDWVWLHDGQRWWVGCPPMMTRDEAMSAWEPTNGEIEVASHDDGADKPKVNDNGNETGETESHDNGTDKPKVDDNVDNQTNKNGEAEPRAKGAEEKDKTSAVDTKVEESVVEKEKATEEVDPKDVEKTPTKRRSPATPGAPEKKSKKPKKGDTEAGDISWTPLTKSGYADFVHSCNGCGPEVHASPPLHQKVSEKTKEPQVIWRPCTQPGIAAFSEFFGQVEPHNMALGDLVAYVHKLNGDWAAIPATTPAYVVEIIQYISYLRGQWGVEEVSDVDYWMRLRTGFQKNYCVSIFYGIYILIWIDLTTIEAPICIYPPV